MRPRTRLRTRSQRLCLGALLCLLSLCLFALLALCVLLLLLRVSGLSDRFTTSTYLACLAAVCDPGRSLCKRVGPTLASDAQAHPQHTIFLATDTDAAEVAALRSALKARAQADEAKSLPEAFGLR